MIWKFGRMVKFFAISLRTPSQNPVYRWIQRERNIRITMTMMSVFLTLAPPSYPSSWPPDQSSCHHWTSLPSPPCPSAPSPPTQTPCYSCPHSCKVSCRLDLSCLICTSVQSTRNRFGFSLCTVGWLVCMNRQCYLSTYSNSVWKQTNNKQELNCGITRGKAGQR